MARLSLRSVHQRLLTVAALGLVALSSTMPAQAYSGAFFPTQSTGNRGVDVKAIQYLLNISADGNFGSGTNTSASTAPGQPDSKARSTREGTAIGPDPHRADRPIDAGRHAGTAWPTLHCA